jgi:hypothetical protein
MILDFLRRVLQVLFYYDFVHFLSLSGAFVSDSFFLIVCLGLRFVLCGRICFFFIRN